MGDLFRNAHSNYNQNTFEISENPSPPEHEFHKLNSDWVIWYHNPSDNTWTPESYKDILEIRSIEDYLVLKNSWSECLPEVSDGMFFMMRKLANGQVIYPLWEDKNNLNGGVWSFKIPKENAADVWFKLCSYTIGETIGCNTPESIEINGVSISPKKNFCIVKIWNRNYTHNNIKLLSEKLTFLNINEVLYSAHSNNIERDNNKIKKFQSSNQQFPNFRKKPSSFYR
jgi:hypothetical protein